MESEIKYLKTPARVLRQAVATIEGEFVSSMTLTADRGAELGVEQGEHGQGLAIVAAPKLVQLLYCRTGVLRYFIFTGSLALARPAPQNVLSIVCG